MPRWRMRVGLAAALLMAAGAIAPAASAEPEGRAGSSPWSTFCSIAFRGQADTSIFAASTFTDIAIGVEPFKWLAVAPAFAAHLYVPAFGAAAGSARFGVSADLAFRQSGDKATYFPLGRESVWAPRARVVVGSRFSDLSDTFFMLTASPFGIYDGSGYYSIGAIDFAFRGGMGSASWGIGVCEFTYFIR